MFEKDKLLSVQLMQRHTHNERDSKAKLASAKLTYPYNHQFFVFTAITIKGFCHKPTYWQAASCKNRWVQAKQEVPTSARLDMQAKANQLEVQNSWTTIWRSDLTQLHSVRLRRKMTREKKKKTTPLFTLRVCGALKWTQLLVKQAVNLLV